MGTHNNRLLNKKEKEKKFFLVPLSIIQQSWGNPFRMRTFAWERRNIKIFSLRRVEQLFYMQKSYFFANPPSIKISSSPLGSPKVEGGVGRGNLIFIYERRRRKKKTCTWVYNLKTPGSILWSPKIVGVEEECVVTFAA